MNQQFSREIMLLGEDGLARLQNAHVAVFGTVIHYHITFYF